MAIPDKKLTELRRLEFKSLETQFLNEIQSGVELALEGKSFTQIREIMRHSPDAIANYIGTFTRCAQLHRSGLQPGQIAFLLRRGRSLVDQYIDLIKSAEGDKNRSYHLEELLLADGRGWSGHGLEKKAKLQPSNKQ